MSNLYLGLMSGTSADGIDVALVNFDNGRLNVVATHYAPYTKSLRQQILGLYQQGENAIQRLGELDVALGKEFAQAAQYLLQKHNLVPTAIKGIGSHGQTIRHHPHQPYPFTLQIADPNIIAAETGITTVADFRRKDVALGGQGAPLVPMFHQHMFASNKINRAIVNIGGIANITLLPQKNPEQIIGFDTGPGNVLLDVWINTQQNKSHDENGAWGQQGKVNTELLKKLLTDPFFQLTPPKSTGHEYFNLTWLQTYLANDIALIDVQATLVELTAQTIMMSIRRYLADGEILICGGGVHNAFLMSRLSALAQPNFTVASTQKYNIAPDWLEAIAFAWLARQTLLKQPGNLPSVTGAKQTAILGGIYYC